MSQKLTKCFWFATEKWTWEIVVDANGLSVFDLLRYQRDGHRRAVQRSDFIMPTFPGAAGLIPRLRARRVPRLGSLRPPPMNHVFGTFRGDTGQCEVELDFRERCVQFPTRT